MQLTDSREAWSDSGYQQRRSESRSRGLRELQLVCLESRYFRR